MAYEIKGLDSLMNKLAGMGGNVIEALGEAVFNTILIAQEDARAFAPEDTGALKLSITGDIEVEDDFVEGKVFTNQPYAIHQEFGTYKMAAQPYMKPAADANKSVFKYLAETELQKAIRRLKK